MKTKQAMDLFEKHFYEGMLCADFEKFKCTHKILLSCIVEAIKESSTSPNSSKEK